MFQLLRRWLQGLFGKRTRKEGQYRVLWSRPTYSKTELVAGTFSAKSDQDALSIFERDYKHGQRFGGDQLVLTCIEQPEITRVVLKKEACPGEEY